MEFFPLHIFPEGSLDASVTTTVLVGVWVVVFFNLRLGWAASGLVVPGYLIPLLIAKPVSASVIVLESVITYLIVYAVSECGQRKKPWSSFFGRDRFFALVLVSVLVRTVIDGWVLPMLAPLISQTWSTDLSYHDNLHSYGLIIVSLLANCFWKPGLCRGLPTMAVILGCTYVIVRFGLMEFTNFNIGNLQYIYEDIASSILASPKAYMILVTTAFIASWMNLYYSWDYNGILIPALLALQWYDPMKIATSLGEAAVILIGSSLLLRLPMMKKATIEGSRKVLLFFNVAYVFRLALGFTVPVFFPDVKVTDVFGFGYLLSTLLAVKAHEQGVPLRISRVTVQVSMMGAVAGSVIGFATTFLPSGLQWEPTPDQAIPADCLAEEPLSDVTNVIVRDKRLAYQKTLPESYVVPDRAALYHFERGIKHLLEYNSTQNEQELRAAYANLSAVNYHIHTIGGRYFYLREESPTNGWGLYVIDRRNPDGMLVEVPAPLDEWATVEAGVAVFQHLNAGSLAIAGSPRNTNFDGSSDVLTCHRTLLNVFQRVVGRGKTLQIRGFSRQQLGNLKPADAKNSASVSESGKSAIWVKSSLPADLQLKSLNGILRDFEIHWQPTPLPNVLRDSAWSGFAELTLSRDDRGRLLSDLTSRASAFSRSRLKTEHGSLGAWLLERKQHIAARGTNQYSPPDLEDLLYIDAEVLRPIVAVARRADSRQSLTSSDWDQLQLSVLTAAAMNYDLILFGDSKTGQDYLILSESGSAETRRHWGTYVIRLGVSRPKIIEVPRPLAELNAYEYGVSLFQRSKSSFLLLAGAHPRTNLDGSADIVQLAHKDNLFNLFHQVLLREFSDQPLLTVQIRAFDAPVDADVVVATADGVHQDGKLRPLTSGLVEMLQSQGTRVRFVDGSPETSGYELNSTLQSFASSHSNNREFASLWLSPDLRTRFGQHVDNSLQQDQFQALGIPTIHVDLVEHLARSQRPTDKEAVTPELRDTIKLYSQTHDIVCLRKLQQQWPAIQWSHVVDRQSQRAFLLGETPSGRLPLVVSLAGTGENTQTVESEGWDRRQIERFINSAATWLEVRWSP